MFERAKFLSFLLVWWWFFAEAAASQLTFTNVKCLSFDKTFAEIETCRLQAIKRSVRELTVKIKVLDPPVDNITIHFQFMKKSNGWQSYYGGITLDACKYFRGQSNPVGAYILNFLMPFTNFNHTCPYNHDIIVDRMRIDSSLLATVPIPSGEYAFYLTWMTNGIKRVYTQLYFQFDEK